MHKGCTRDGEGRGGSGTSERAQTEGAHARLSRQAHRSELAAGATQQRQLQAQVRGWEARTHELAAAQLEHQRLEAAAHMATVLAMKKQHEAVLEAKIALVQEQQQQDADAMGELLSLKQQRIGAQTMQLHKAQLQHERVAEEGAEQRAGLEELMRRQARAMEAAEASSAEELAALRLEASRDPLAVAGWLATLAAGGTQGTHASHAPT